jgi:hypothetical protein
MSILARRIGPDLNENNPFPSDSIIQLGPRIDGSISGERSGETVDINNSNQIVIGSPFYTTGGNRKEGQIRVFSFNGSSWQQVGPIILGSTISDFLGSESSKIDSSGNTVAYCRRKPGGDSDVGTKEGEAAELINNSWVRYDISNYISILTGSRKQIGMDDGGINIVAGQHDVTSPINAPGVGRVFVYQKTGGVYSLKGDNIYGLEENEQFGFGCDINSNGNIIAAGAPQSPTAAGLNSGRVRSFSWNGSSWVQRGQNIDSTIAGDRLGGRIAINGNGTLIAARSNSGVFIYSFNGSTWSLLSAINQNNIHQLEMSANGSIIVTSDKLIARVYRRLGNSWILQYSLGTPVNNQGVYGIGLSPDGTKLAIGLPYASGGEFNTRTESGVVFVYQMTFA